MAMSKPFAEWISWMPSFRDLNFVVISVWKNESIESLTRPGMCMETSLFPHTKKCKNNIFMEPQFPAPTEEIELNIVEYCLNVLGLQFGEYWYKWFNSNKSETNHNHTLQIECNVSNLSDKIRASLPTVLNIEKIHKIQEIPLPEWCDFRYQYFIHFKSKN
jgi:hypothetical protein